MIETVEQEVAPKPENEQPHRTASGAFKPAKITIALAANGTIQIDAPIQDKVLCYGLLHAALDTIQEWHVAQQQANRQQQAQDARLLKEITRGR